MLLVRIRLERIAQLIGQVRREASLSPGRLQLLAERSGVSKAGGWLDYSAIDIALRLAVVSRLGKANSPSSTEVLAVLTPDAVAVLENFCAIVAKADGISPEAVLMTVESSAASLAARISKTRRSSRSCRTFRTT